MWLDLDNAEYIREQLNFPGCQIALRVDRDITAEDGTVRLHDTRYFVTSIDPGAVRAEELLPYVRNHWQIENCVFFLKDRWWEEDRHWTRRPGLSEWLAHLTTAATTVLRVFRIGPDEPIRAQAQKIEWAPARGLAILNRS